MENENVIVMSPEYNKAVVLHRRITANAQAAQESLYEMCRGLKEMRDGKLYKELNYQNFEDYCETEIGFTRIQAYKFISVVENLSEDFVNSSLQIGVTKLSLLAKLDEPQREEIIQNVDLENTSVRELKETISQLETKGKELESKLQEKQEELDDFRAGAKRRQDMLLDKTKSLMEQVKTLETRPVEVAVQENTEEIDRLTSENEELRKQLAEKPMIQETFSDGNSFSEMQAEFGAYLKTLNDTMNHLCAFIGRHKNEYNMQRYISKVKEKVDVYIKVLKEEEECQ